jgi:hypothetical protein
VWIWRRPWKPPEILERAATDSGVGDEERMYDPDPLGT